MLLPLLLLTPAAALEYVHTLSASDPFVAISPGVRTSSSNTTTLSARSGLSISVSTPLIGAQFEGRVSSSASLVLQSGTQRKNELASPGPYDVLIGDSFSAEDGAAGTKLSTTFDGDLVLRSVELTFDLITAKTAFAQLSTITQDFVSEGKLAPGPKFEGTWSVAGEYARGSAVAVPLATGASFAVLTGAIGDVGNYTATLSPGEGKDETVYSARNSVDGTGVLWLGALDPGTQYTLRLEGVGGDLGLKTLRQWGDSLAPSPTTGASSGSNPSASASASASAAPAPAKNTNIGAIVGGIVGGIGGLLLLLGAVILYRRRSKQRPLDGPIDDDKHGNEYQTIVEDFVTPYTLTASSSFPSTGKGAGEGEGAGGAASGSGSGSGSGKTGGSMQERPVLHVQTGTGIREADAGPVEDTLPPLYDPSWGTPTASSPATTMPGKR